MLPRWADRRPGGRAGPIGTLLLAPFLIAGMILAGGAPRAQDRLAGPVRARVLSVVDGDTIEVRAAIWLDQEVFARVRLAGVDAPELRGRCERERELASAARDYLAVRLAPRDGVAVEVQLHDIRYGKYAGRVLARVETLDGADLGRGLMGAGLARPYAGGSRVTWCQEVQAD